ncbi:MAG: tyrosine-type recombinase/integrase [Acidimicrobiia bacterium]
MTADIQGLTIPDLLPSWKLSLRGRRLSPRTIETYDLAARQLDDWLRRNHGSISVTDITSRHVSAYLAEVVDTRAAATAKQRYASLLQFFEWLLIEEEIAANPMAGKKVRPPQVPPQPVAVIKEEKLSELLDSVHGSGYEDRRDAAILYLLADTGIRLGEIANLKPGDVDSNTGVVIVRGKGDKVRAVPYSRKPAVALDRYLRARMRHKDAALPWLWLGLKGRMSDSGIAQMVRRRGRAVGIEGLHPHIFRHTFAHLWLAAGGQEGDLQRIAGWADRQMLGRYGASAAHERALHAHEQFSPIERLR